MIHVERGEGINRAANDAPRNDPARSPTTTAAENTPAEHWAYDYDPFGRRIAKYPISEAAAQAWIEHGDEAALAHALREARTHATQTHIAASPVANTTPHRVGLDPPLPNTRGPHAQTSSAPTLFCWDGNRLLSERKGDTHQLYLYEPDSFVPLAIVRWKAANEGSSDDGNAGTPPPNTDDRPDLLPPELLSLKERYPEQWARIEAQRRKLARQLGQAPDPEPPKPPKAEVFHVHVDHLGTPREITDTDGHLVWTATYAAWGRAVTANPSRRILTRQGNTVTETQEEQAHPIECNLRFQGQYADAESGLHYNRFRHYDPDIGRFASQDPIGLAAGFNFYRLAANPIGFIDPLGLSSARLRRSLGMAVGDCHEAHHLIPEEVMSDPEFSDMFDRLKSMGFDPDGPANGIALPGNETLARQTGLPGHWSSHDQFTATIRTEIGSLYNGWKRGQVSDTQLALGVRDIQKRAETNIRTEKVRLNSKCRLI